MQTWKAWKEKCRWSVIDKNGRQTCTNTSRRKNACIGKNRYCEVIPKPISAISHMDFKDYIKTLPREEQWAARTERDRLEIIHWKTEYAELRGALCMALNKGLFVDFKAEVIAILKRFEAGDKP